MEHVFDTPGPLDVFVELGAGVLAAEATQTNVAQVQIDGPREADFVVEQRGTQLTVITPRGWLFETSETHTVTVAVPRESTLSTKTGSAETRVGNGFRSLNLKTGSGGIRIAGTSGAVVIQSGSGDVSAQKLAGDVRIKSGSGDVEIVEVTGTAAISTGSGDMLLGLLRDRAVLKTGSGHLQVRHTEADLTLTGASGDLVVGSATRGRLTVKNVSGGIRVGIPAGTPVWTEISSLTGRVASSLPSVGRPAEGQDHLELRATTVSGDIQLEQA